MGTFFRLNRGSSYRIRSRVPPHRPFQWKKGKQEIVFVPHATDVQYLRALCNTDNPPLVECRENGAPAGNEPFNKDMRFPNAKSVKVVADPKRVKPKAEDIKAQEERYLAEKKEKPPVTSDEESEVGLPITEYTIKEASKFIAGTKDIEVLNKLKEDELTRDDGREPRVGIINLIEDAIAECTITEDDGEDDDDDGVDWG